MAKGENIGFWVLKKRVVTERETSKERERNDKETKKKNRVGKTEATAWIENGIREKIDNEGL